MASLPCVGGLSCGKGALLQSWLVAAGGVESQLRPTDGAPGQLRPTDRSVGPVVLGVVTHPCFLGQTGRE